MLKVRSPMAASLLGRAILGQRVYVDIVEYKEHAPVPC
jgi:hypothetical protein